MSEKVLELFGKTKDWSGDWQQLVGSQQCPFLGKKCIKVRKSQPEISIGTCSLAYGSDQEGIMICPFRLLERRQIFVDCLHLLTAHQPGNQIHIIPEVSVPGGSVDYFLTSAKNNRIIDFVGIELQTLDTTGTVWPSRQRFIRARGLDALPAELASTKPFGMNWKMTAKTILVQLHHKVQTFEHINKHLVLVVQDRLLTYMKREFAFNHLKVADVTEPMHFHSYKFAKSTELFDIALAERFSTDTDGISKCLGLQISPKVELETIIKQLQAKMSDRTLFQL